MRTRWLLIAFALVAALMTGRPVHAICKDCSNTGVVVCGESYVATWQCEASFTPVASDWCEVLSQPYLCDGKLVWYNSLCLVGSICDIWPSRPEEAAALRTLAHGGNVMGAMQGLGSGRLCDDTGTCRTFEDGTLHVEGTPACVESGRGDLLPTPDPCHTVLSNGDVLVVRRGGSVPLPAGAFGPVPPGFEE